LRESQAIKIFVEGGGVRVKGRKERAGNRSERGRIGRQAKKQRAGWGNIGKQPKGVGGVRLGEKGLPAEPFGNGVSKNWPLSPRMV